MTRFCVSCAPILLLITHERALTLEILLLTRRLGVRRVRLALPEPRSRSIGRRVELDFANGQRAFVSALYIGLESCFANSNIEQTSELARFVGDFHLIFAWLSV